MQPYKAAGKAGEDYTVRQLKEAGYQILCRNYHSRHGEIDIIAADSRTICFIEVKTRKQSPLVPATDAVTWAKQSKIIKTAMAYLQQYPSGLQPRFDVSAVTLAGDGRVVGSDYIAAAFDTTGHLG